MNDINDKTYRLALIDKFLDCDTSVAEERSLARFYRECMLTGCVPEGEEDVCDIITATVKADAAETPAVATCGCDAVSRRRAVWHWLAAACVAAAVVAGAVAALKPQDADRQVLAQNGTATVHAERGQTAGGTDAGASAEEPAAGERVQADADGAGNGGRSAAARQAGRPKAAGSKACSCAGRAAEDTDIGSVYNMAVATFGDDAAISIERKGCGILLSTTDGSGESHRYVAAKTDDGITLTAL